MSQAVSEAILHPTPLPQFLLDFKTTINSHLIPHLNTLIAQLQSPQPSPLLTVLVLILLVLAVRTVVDVVLGSGKAYKPVQQAEVSKEIKDLMLEIRNLKNTWKKVVAGVAKNDTHRNQHQGDDQKQSKEVAELLELYREAVEDFNSLADFILNSHEAIFKELKNVKKMRGSTEKNSSQASRDGSVLQLTQSAPTLTHSKSVDTEPATEQKQQQAAKNQALETKTAPRPVKAPVPAPKRRNVPPPPVARP